MTEYREVEGFPHYRIGNDGTVLSNHSGEWKPRSIYLDASRHYRISLYSNGKYKNTRVHQLVARAFIGPCPPGLEVCHNSGVTTDNRVENLRYDTRASNMQDCVKFGSWKYRTPPLGEKHHAAKLKEFEVVEIRRLHQSGIKAKVLAQMFLVTPALIYMISKRNIWKSVI